MKRFIISLLTLSILITNITKVFANEEYKSTFDGEEMGVTITDPYAVMPMSYDYEGFTVTTTYKGSSVSTPSSHTEFNQFLYTNSNNSYYDFCLTIKFPRSLEAGQTFYFGAGLTGSYMSNFTKLSPYIQLYNDNTHVGTSSAMTLSFSNNKLYLSNTGYITSSTSKFNKIKVFFNGKTTSGYSTYPGLTFNYVTVTTGENEKLNEDAQATIEKQTGLFESILNAVVGIPNFILNMTPTKIAESIDTILVSKFTGLGDKITNIPSAFQTLFDSVLGAFAIFTNGENTSFFQSMLNVIQWGMKGAFGVTATFFTNFKDVMTTLFNSTFGIAGLFMVNMSKLISDALKVTFETDGNFFKIFYDKLSDMFDNFFDKYGTFFTSLVDILYSSIVGPIIDFLDGWLLPLFVPSEDFFTNLFDEIHGKLREKLGILLLPWDLLISFIDTYSNLNDTDGIIYIPNIKVQNQIFIKEQQLDLKNTIQSVIGNDLYNLYFAATDVILYLSLIRLANRKMSVILRRSDI